jgi:hypothetical protein
MITFLIYLIVLIVIGAIIWAIIQALPLPEPWKKIVLLIVGLIFLLVILAQLGLFGAAVAPLNLRPLR